MARTSKPLTALELKLFSGGTIAVGGVSGLYLRKTANQSFFFLRFTDQSGRHDISLGKYPQLSLANARSAASVMLLRIANGENVLAARKAKAAPATPKPVKHTFSEVAADWIAERSKLNYWAHDSRGEERAVSILEIHV